MVSCLRGSMAPSQCCLHTTVHMLLPVQFYPWGWRGQRTWPSPRRAAAPSCGLARQQTPFAEACRPGPYAGSRGPCVSKLLERRLVQPSVVSVDKGTPQVASAATRKRHGPRSMCQGRNLACVCPKPPLLAVYPRSPRLDTSKTLSGCRLGGREPRGVALS